VRTIHFALSATLVLFSSFRAAADDASSNTDAGDLWRRVRHHHVTSTEDPASPDVTSHKPFFVIAPSVK